MSEHAQRSGWVSAWLWICLMSGSQAARTGLRTSRTRSHLLALNQATERAEAVDWTTKAPYQIPRIFHQVYLEGEDKFQEKAKEGKFSLKHRVSCKQHHQHWEYKFWTKKEAEALVQESYPWFWSTYTRYTHWVREMVAHHACMLSFLICIDKAAAYCQALYTTAAVAQNMTVVLTTK